MKRLRNEMFMKQRLWRALDDLECVTFPSGEIYSRYPDRELPLQEMRGGMYALVTQ
jgi:hypothetical protein